MKKKEISQSYGNSWKLIVGVGCVNNACLDTSTHIKIVHIWSWKAVEFRSLISVGTLYVHAMILNVMLKKIFSDVRLFGITHFFNTFVHFLNYKGIGYMKI